MRQGVKKLRAILGNDGFDKYIDEALEKKREAILIEKSSGVKSRTRFLTPGEVDAIARRLERGIEMKAMYHCMFAYCKKNNRDFWLSLESFRRFFKAELIERQSKKNRIQE